MPYGLPFSTSGRGVGATLVLLAIFAGLVVIVGVLLTQVGHSMRVGTVLLRLQDTTAEIRVRMTVALLIGFVALAERFGLETILGAFLAGAVVSLLDRDSASHPHFRIKLDAIGYGFLCRSSLSQAASGSICKACSPSPRRCSAFLCPYLRCWWSAVCQRCSTYPTSAATRPSRRGYCRQPRCRSS